MVTVQRSVRPRNFQHAAIAAILDGQRGVLGKVEGGGRNHAAHDHPLPGESRRIVGTLAEAKLLKRDPVLGSQRTASQRQADSERGAAPACYTLRNWACSHGSRTPLRKLSTVKTAPGKLS